MKWFWEDMYSTFESIIKNCDFLRLCGSQLPTGNSHLVQDVLGANSLEVMGGHSTRDNVYR